MSVAFSRSLFLKLFLPVGELLIVCGILTAIFLPNLIAIRNNAEALSAGLDTLEIKNIRS